MKPKLNKKQKVNLLHLANGRKLYYCTSPGRSCKKVHFETGGDAGSYMAALDTFYSWGLFDEEEKWFHGLRYSVLTLNENGKQALVEAEAANAQEV